MKKAIVVVAALFGIQPACHGQAWPQVKPVIGEITLTDPETAKFQLAITDSQERPSYVLSCQSGDLEDDDFNFSGLFHCRLISRYSKENVSSLLVESLPQTADWEGRARFLLNQVVGQCADTPDWGAERTFVLRRMRLTLAVHDVRFGGSVEHPEVQSFKFSYGIEPDERAVSPIALKAGTSEPAWFASGDGCVKEALANH
jgi:hypothetical protein